MSDGPRVQLKFEVSARVGLLHFYEMVSSTCQLKSIVREENTLDFVELFPFVIFRQGQPENSAEASLDNPQPVNQ